MRCRTGGSIRNRNTAGTCNSYRLPAKTHKPIASIAALTAQPLAALPPYGCAVPFTGSERHGGLQVVGHFRRTRRRSSNYNAKIVCTNPKASKVFEKGKVYDVVNGFIYHKGKLIMQPRVFENFEELHDHAIADFVELIDE